MRGSGSARRFGWGVVGLLLTCGAASAQGVAFSLTANIDLASTANAANPQFIGSNPSAVAWDGSSLWVGGYNASAVTANTGIVQINNVLADPTFGQAFGVLSTPSFRGVSGMAVRNGTLAVALDTGGGSGDSVRAFDTTNNNALTWRIGGTPGGASDTSRRGNGVAFDPGFNGGGTNQGVAYLSIGSGRRHLLNTETGAYINGQNNGAVINLTPLSTTWRDLTFDPATGDLYARESNRITKAVRNGDNTFTNGGSTVIGNLATAGGVDNQNIEFVNSAEFGNFLVVNDRMGASSGQAAAGVIKIFDTEGNLLTSNLADLGFAPGSGAYDFSWDPVSQTLAISDFTNRRVYILTPVPEPGLLLGLAAAGLGAGRWVRCRRPAVV